MRIFVRGAVYSCLIVLSAALTGHAQERAAGGAIEAQVTWSALKSSVDTARAESKGAHDRIDMIVACNEKKMVYAPNTKGKDKDGCVGITLGKDCTFNETAMCGKEGCSIQYHNRATDKWDRSEVPTTWKDGDVMVWKLDYSVNNFAGAQCKDGTLHRWYTGH